MEMNKENKLPGFAARFFSVIFYPLITPLYGLVIVFVAPTLFWYIPDRAKLLLFLIFLFDNLLVPALLMPFFRYRHLISSLSPDKREERTIPLVTVALWYAITSFILFRLQIPAFFKAYAYSLTMVSIALLTLNRWWKVSSYSAAAGVVLALILSLSASMSVSLPVYVASWAVISGGIMTSRLKLGMHDLKEVFAGFLTGFAITLGIMLLLQ